jgi:hypothetical protein
MQPDDIPVIPGNLPLDTWKRNWRIHQDRVHCAECNAAQFAHFSNCDFQHEPLCSREGLDQRPWQDLLKFIDDPRYQWE